MARQRINWREVTALVFVAVVVLFFWNTWFVYPLRLMVVMFHEMSHAAAALVTGGSVEQIRLSPREGGMTMTRGGNGFLIVSAGYLGSLFAGGIILLAAARSRRPNTIAGGLGVLLAITTLLVVKPTFGFGFFYGLAAGLVMILCAWGLAPRVNEYVLKTVGVTSCLYALFDIEDDILSRPGSPSDAAALAEVTGIPTIVWGLFWIAIAIGALIFFIRRACTIDSPPPYP